MEQKADSANPQNPSGGDALAGFARLVEYIKRERARLFVSQTPEFQARQKKIERYQNQKDLTPIPEMKKGLQLKTAA